ncbi:hypothetical protein MHF_1471 [Mycoplasma haemofelis Ohio2]|uniref:Uncharacterized protein n=1 Tax=Mycoplasma haemofelis (strain Ohio2) TaxID=859194 RepID=F6FGZ6_MYCHI|nr:hypothetical protein MHF_1471 [Mycoplasma haemofelis Ohio2]
MSVPTSLKVALPTVAVPSAAGASYLVFFKEGEVKDSLKTLVTKEGKRVLLDVSNDNHDNIWSEIAKEYKSNNSITAKGISKEAADKEQVKNYCRTTASLTDVNLLNTYRDLCSRSTLRDQVNLDLKSKNKSWFTSTNTSDWQSLKDAYGSGDGESLLIPKEGQASATVTKTDITPELLMKWCSSISSNLYLNLEDQNYKIASFNCTK